MMRTIRKLLGREMVEKSVEPVEFGYLRPVLESHLDGGWSMGKTPENPAIVVQFDHKTIPSDTYDLELRLKEIAEQHGFEVEVIAHSDTYHSKPYSNMPHTDSINRR